MAVSSVRERASSAQAVRVTVPGNFRPRRAGTLTSALAFGCTSAASASGTSTNTRTGSTCVTTNSGVSRPLGWRKWPTSTCRAVTTPSNGAVRRV